MTARGFWKGRSVVVTGHTGFKGGWLCWWLKRLGARVAGIALDPPTSPNLFETTSLAGEISSTRADLRDLAAVSVVFQKEQAEVVFHLAAQSLVRESYRQPVDTFSTNIAGTVNCLEAARTCSSVRAMVIVTTDKCYRNRGWSRGYREEDELGGDDPYSASKASAELITHAYRKAFFDVRSGSALIASARAGNVIGGGDWAIDRLVPDAMRAFAKTQRLQVRNPESTRPWQHVLEPLSGYLMLAERLCGGDETAAEAWNFGPDAGAVTTVSWVADQLALRWGKGAGWEHDRGAHPHEAVMLALDSSKARDRLGWRPLLSLDKALDWAVEWYRAYASGLDCRDLTLQQISRFEELGGR